MRGKEHVIDGVFPVLALGVVVLLAGCAALAPSSRMAEVAAMVPGRWVATEEARAGVDHEWISRFGDRTLDALVAEGLRNNADLVVAAERVKQAEATAKLAGVSLRPTATAGVDGSRSKRQFIGFPGGGAGGGGGGGGGGGSTTTVYGTSLDVSWEFDLWGRVRAGQAAEVGAWQAEGQEYRAARASLAAQVAKAWFALAETNEQIGLARAALDIRQKTEEAITDRFDLALGGEGGTAAQLRLARSETESARATVEQWKGERERSLREIEVLVGRYPSGHNLSSRGLPGIPSRPPTGLPSGLLLRRPDIQAAERRFAGAGKKLREAELAVYPNFSLTGSYGTNTESLRDLLKSSAGVWTLASDAVQPILTGGRIRHEKELRQSVERQRLAELQREVLVAFGEVESALVAEGSLSKRVHATSEAARHAREAAQSAEKDFEGGTGDVLTLLEAQARRISTASQLATLRRMQLDNRVNLHLALGGDFEVRAK